MGSNRILVTLVLQCTLYSLMLVGVHIRPHFYEFVAEPWVFFPAFVFELAVTISVEMSLDCQSTYFCLVFE